MDKGDIVTRECWHCGKTSDARYLGEVFYNKAEGGPIENGPTYELYECLRCSEALVYKAFWHSGMEPGDARTSPYIPSEEHFNGAKLLAEMKADRTCMEQAIEEARKCRREPGRSSPTPCVGAVVARSGKLIGAAHRGELKPGDHAEFTLLQGRLSKEDLSNVTLYVTLEPCTKRSPKKHPCANWVMDRRIPRVFVGMLDPDEQIRGLGVMALRKAGIHVALFPQDLMSTLEGMNTEFIQHKSKAPQGLLRRIWSLLNV